MIQLLPILLVAVVLAADGGLAARGFGAPLAIVTAWAPMLAGLFLLGLTVRWCAQRMSKGLIPGPIIFADRVMRWCLCLIVIAHGVSVLGFGWLVAIRGVTGDLILIDEVIALTPPLLGIICTWWLYYPIEKRLREAVLMRRLDDGAPVYPVPTRARYVLAQARLHLLLLLVPILLILVFDELIEWAVQFAPERFQSPVLADLLTLVCGLGVFMIAPLLARLVLSLRRLPDGPLRRDLSDICRRHGVKVRDFLLWGTGGTMINAAVMGLTGRLRFVMISDALVESMPRPQVLAVMAHEVGHVRRHHMPWMLLGLLALLGGCEAVVSGGRWLAATTGLAPAAWPPDAKHAWLEGVWMLLTLVAALWLFGWVSRRLERQADTFAVQHLSGMSAEQRGQTEAEPTAGGDDFDSESRDDPNRSDLPNETPGRISHAASAAMIDALRTVSRLNHVDPHRHSWRHGSIAWRIGYLRTLIGTPVEGLPIDRQVRWIKRLCAIMLIALVGYIAWMEWPAGWT